ncbi:MAG TPA: glycoside hydrolase domain-containing protein [Xanthobacteraceae bacterium]|nr:glycoside hydrolase domain-containing protein [Xanthobacteraceae bacterium]
MIIDSDVGFENHVQLLTNNKIDTIGRYFCAANDPHVYKLISRNEARQIAQANIRLFTIYEGPVDLTKGQNHANTAMNCAANIGQPQGSAIYFGIEKDDGFTNADIPQITAYFKDIKNTIAGKFDIGIYSNGTPCGALLQAGLVKYTWLAAASYAHDGTWSFYASGLWTLAQVGPLDIVTQDIPSWRIPPKAPWTIDVNFAKGNFGSFTANPPAG